MKALMIALILLVATAAFAVPAVITDPADLTGAWTFNVETANGVVSSDATLTTDGQGGVIGTLSSPAGDLQIFGTVTDETVRLYAKSGDVATLAFTGARTPGNIAGSVTFLDAGADANWTATRK